MQIGIEHHLAETIQVFLLIVGQVEALTNHLTYPSMIYQLFIKKNGLKTCLCLTKPSKVMAKQPHLIFGRREPVLIGFNSEPQFCVFTSTFT